MKEKQKSLTRMKIIKQINPKVRSRLPSLLMAAAVFALNTLPALAQSTTFSSTDLKTGISNSLAVIMMFGFVLGIACVIYGGFAIRRGDVDQGKMSIIGGAIIAAAPTSAPLSMPPGGCLATTVQMRAKRWAGLS